MSKAATKHADSQSGRHARRMSLINTSFLRSRPARRPDDAPPWRTRRDKRDCTPLQPSGPTHDQQHVRQGTADVHAHTNYSDGVGSVTEVLDFAQRRTTLDVLAITDHDTIAGALRARDLVARGGYRFELIVGRHISSPRGHLLAPFLPRPTAPAHGSQRTNERVHVTGGLARA